MLYTRRVWMSSMRDWHEIYALSTMSDRDVMTVLIDGYRRRA